MTQILAKAFLASAAGGLAAFALAPAHAELGAPRTALVRFADLDLGHAAGRVMLHKRIAHAAAMVCGPDDALSFSSIKWVGDCQARTVDNASRAVVTVTAQRDGAIQVAAS